MQECGFKAIQRRTCVPQTSDGRAVLPSPNLLPDQPLPSQPNQVRAGDICLGFASPQRGSLVAGCFPAVGSYIPSSTRWLYLAVVIDLCSRRIVGWSPADHLKASLVCDAFQQAPGSRTLNKADHPIFHSDRGSQYGSGVFRQLLAGHHFRQSMSARANPYHNA